MNDITAAGAVPHQPPTPPKEEVADLSETDSIADQAMEEGAALAMEEVQAQLDAAGLEMDPETGEIYGPEAAFDPRPRARGRGGRFKRGGRHRKLAARHATRRAGPWHHRLGRYRYFDPAPSRARGAARRAKDPLKKVMATVAPYAAILGFAGSLYNDYKAHAAALGTDIPGAVKADLTNFDAGAAAQRVIDHAGGIVTPLILGAIVKKAPIGMASVRRPIGDLFIGAGAAKLVKHALDPPAFEMRGFPMNQGAPLGVTAPHRTDSWGV